MRGLAWSSSVTSLSINRVPTRRFSISPKRWAIIKWSSLFNPELNKISHILWTFPCFYNFVFLFYNFPENNFENGLILFCLKVYLVGIFICFLRLACIILYWSYGVVLRQKSSVAEQRSKKLFSYWLEIFKIF